MKTKFIQDCFVKRHWERLLGQHCDSLRRAGSHLEDHEMIHLLMQRLVLVGLVRMDGPRYILPPVDERIRALALAGD